MRGASGDLPPVSIHPWCCMYVYRCGGSSFGDVVMWRGWSAHHEDQRRRKKWWRSCRGCRGTNAWTLIASKFPQNSWKLVDKVDKTNVYPGLFKPKAGAMSFGPIEGLLACDLYLFYNIPVFGTKVTRHTRTRFWQKCFRFFIREIWRYDRYTPKKFKSGHSLSDIMKIDFFLKQVFHMCAYILHIYIYAVQNEVKNSDRKFATI